MKDLNLYILTFNCARTLIQPDVFGSYIFHALPKASTATLPDVLVLALEEIAPIGISFLGGSFLTPYYNAFRSAVRVASGDAVYTNLLNRNVGLTAIMVFTKHEIASTVDYIQTGGVGFGVQEMGNKGAVGVRLGLRIDSDSTEVMETTFVAAHLTAMEDEVERRNEDWKSIVQRLVFVDDKTGANVQGDENSEQAPLLQGLPTNGSGPPSGLFIPRSHLFFAGDLNYRISDTGPAPDEHKRFPSPKAPMGDALHHTSYLPRDQLSREQKAGKTLHGLVEEPINFPPTYKYSTTKARVPAQMDDVDAWQWSKHRWPSWCDRILYLDLPQWMKSRSPDLRIRIHGYTSLPLFLTSDHRPVALSVSLPWTSIPTPPEGVDDIRLSPPFEIDPDWRTRRATARKKEILVGIGAYLGLTWEGNGVLVATIIGAVGGYLIIRSLLAA